MPPAVIQAVEPGYRAALAGERSQVDLPFDNGIYEVTIVPVRADSGEVMAGIAIVRDVTAQRNSEYQLQVIAGQEAALRELSTPLIPLADNVVVMPIIGTIDARRAQQIMETLLEGIAANQADVALLDISGVRVVDTQVADALLRVAQAAKLLGTQIVLTGIRAEVAQTIVHLGADMAGIVTRSNLQDGLRYALTIADANVAPAASFSRGS
jgi:rsbT co-antagonist protein RsbR